MDISRDPGPDGILPRVLTECIDVLAQPLRVFFPKSLDAGMLPSDWSLGEVTPIFKKGNKHDPASYRPISLTAVPSKVLESLVKDKILEDMQTLGLLHPAQHGFLPRRWCATQLLEVLEEWSSAADDGVPVDVAYLDFRKAFDTNVSSTNSMRMASEESFFYGSRPSSRTAGNE